MRSSEMRTKNKSINQTIIFQITIKKEKLLKKEMLDEDGKKLSILRTKEHLTK